MDKVFKPVRWERFVNCNLQKRKSTSLMFGRRWFTLQVFGFYNEKRQCSYYALYFKPPTLTYMDQSFRSYNLFSVPFFSYLSFDHTDAMVNLKSQYNQSSTLKTYAILWGWLQRPIEEINDSSRVPLLCYSIFLLCPTNNEWHLLKTGLLKHRLIWLNRDGIWKSKNTSWIK